MSAPPRLLLDEHYAPRLAQALRDAGHDAVALLDVPAAAGLPDPEVYALAIEQGRRVVTENVRDLRPLLARALADGLATAPLLLVHPGRHPRSRAGERDLASALVSWCQGCARRDAPLEDWLRADLPSPP